MNDQEIRETLCQFIENSCKEKFRIIDEFVIRNSRADIVVVKEDGLTGYEIKGDTDSYARLPLQIKEYSVHFQKNYLVVGESHKKSAEKHVPEFWGIICVSKKKKSLKTEVIREAGKNPRYSFKKQFALLWRKELVNILAANGLKKCSRMRKAPIRKFLYENVSQDILQKQFCEELFERDWTL